MPAYGREEDRRSVALAWTSFKPSRETLADTVRITTKTSSIELNNAVAKESVLRDSLVTSSGAHLEYRQSSLESKPAKNKSSSSVARINTSAWGGILKGRMSYSFRGSPFLNPHTTTISYIGYNTP